MVVLCSHLTENVDTHSQSLEPASIDIYGGYEVVALVFLLDEALLCGLFRRPDFQSPLLVGFQFSQ